MLILRHSAATGSTHYFLPLPLMLSVRRPEYDPEESFLLGRSLPESMCIFFSLSTTFPVPLQLSQAFVGFAIISYLSYHMSPDFYLNTWCILT